MSLRQRILLTLALTIAAMVVVFYIGSRFIVLSNYETLERNATLDNIERVGNALEGQLTALLNTVGDWSYWGDTYNFMLGEYSEYAEVNLLDSNYESLQIESMIFVDENREWVFGEFFNRETGVVEAIPDTLRSAIEAQNNLFFSADEPEILRGVKGILMVDDLPVLVGSRAILPGSREGRVEGTMIWLRVLDAARVQELGEQTKFDLSLYLLDDTLPDDVHAMASTLSTGSPYAAHVVDGDTIAGYGLINDLNGEPAFIFRIVEPRLIYAEGINTLTIFIGFVILIGLVATAALGLQINRLILSPLDKLVGEVRRVGRSGDFSGRVDFSGPGEFEQVAVSINNALNELNKSQQELGISEKRLGTVISNAPVVLVAVDAEGKMTLMEGRALDMFTMGNLPLDGTRLIGKRVEDVFKRSPELLDVFRRGMAGETFSRVVAFDDPPVAIELWCMPHEDGGFIAVAADVTDRQRMQQALEQAKQAAEESNQVKSQFLASMSHELRTPLNAILNFTQFVSSGMVGEVNDEQKDLLGKTVESGKHLLALINDVLDISKIESGALKLFVEENVDLGKELDTLSSTAKTLLADKPVDLIIEKSDPLPLILCDKRRIRQIMLNLVSNACKFTDAGTVTLTLKPEDAGHIMFIVKDTGPGIASEEHSEIFETFRQTHTGLRQGEGTGLGLPISRRLAEAHGGKLWLVSEAGKGATFYVRLPVKSENLKGMLPARGVKNAV